MPDEVYVQLGEIGEVIDPQASEGVTASQVLDNMLEGFSPEEQVVLRRGGLNVLTAAVLKRREEQAALDQAGPKITEPIEQESVPPTSRFVDRRISKLPSITFSFEPTRIKNRRERRQRLRDEQSTT